MSEAKASSDQFRGYLMKWTNYIKGYQRRWFVLCNGLISYYRNPAEMSHTCRGTINLAGAFIDTIDSCSFVISNGGSQVYHLRAGSEIERQRWVTTLELAKAKAIKALASDEDSDVENEAQDFSVKSLSSKLEDLITCNNLVTSHGSALQRTISDVSDLATPNHKSSNDSRESIGDTQFKLKLVNEKAQLFRITSNAMIDACKDLTELAQAYEKRFQKLLQYERVKRTQLEETVETLAKQHNQLERACKKEVYSRSHSGSMMLNVESPTLSKGLSDSIYGDETRTDDVDEEDEPDEFFDAVSDDPASFGLGDDDTTLALSYELPGEGASTLPFIESETDSISSGPGSSKLGVPLSGEAVTGDGYAIRRSKSEKLLEPSKESNHHRRFYSQDLRDTFTTGEVTPTQKQQQQQLSQLVSDSLPPTKYRTTIPDRPTVSMNLWSIMKNCIGKELSKIPMPVNFSEPLSMTQRITEELEYSDILDRAACCDSSLEQICHVAAFGASCYSSTAQRTGKPFNPMLGETYECDRTADMGWRSLTEQVSHHPPSVAHHVEGKGWTLWQTFTMSSKFRGHYLQVVPLGTAHCTFADSGNYYTWKKVTSTVHNIIVGKLWIDQSGEMDIINHTTGEKCHMKYHSYSYFSRDPPKRVTGFVTDKDNVTRYVVSGFWDQKMECAKVVYNNGGGGMPTGKKIIASKQGNAQTLAPSLLWSRAPLAPGSSRRYNFGEFTCSLNQPEGAVSPTDSRLRPDIRVMEEGDFDEANRVKGKLEESQRTRRRRRETEAEEAASCGRVYEGYKPTWFELTKDEHSDSDIFVYKGGYWEAKEIGDWTTCPKIYET